MTDNLELDELSESAVLDDEPILKKDVGMDDFDIPSSASDLEAVYDIPVKVSAILGKSKMKVSQLLKLNKGGDYRTRQQSRRGDRHLCQQQSGCPRRGGCR